MKIRDGFVSNSSSSSFTIEKEHLTDKQIDSIINHIDVANDMISKTPDKFANEYSKNSGGPMIYDFVGCTRVRDAWNVSVTKTRVVCATSMDNFSMEGFMDLIGVDAEKIKNHGDGYLFGRTPMVDPPEDEEDILEALGHEECMVISKDGGNYGPIELWIEANMPDMYEKYGVLIRGRIVAKDAERERHHEEMMKRFKK